VGSGFEGAGAVLAWLLRTLDPRAASSAFSETNPVATMPSQNLNKPQNQTQNQQRQVGVNEQAITSEVSPFGGVKQSGLGREQGT
jgi:acyl-CoA reductase-like NAD-dependent aldehyde dehydrogenase